MPMNDRNLVITGFMGTGKSAVGKALAERLSRAFVDTDTMIEERTGSSIPELFAHHGERHFRQLEAEVCQDLSRRRGLVISTGGWTLGNPENRLALETNGLVVCLLADEATLVQRIGQAEGRPMLRDEAWQGRVSRLLADRRPSYFSFPLQVETSHMSLTSVVNRVLLLYRTFCPVALPAALPVVTPDSGAYAVLFGEGLLQGAGALTLGHGRWTQMVHVSDTVVGPLYQEQLDLALTTGADALAESPDPGVRACVMPTGEQNKTLATVADLYDGFLVAGLDRNGVVLALGGGVVGDVVGFAAATFLRGVPVIQVPTTLLSMVDSSVGGKTGVDLPAGKNLVGAFKQPRLVICDPLVLRTLDAAELHSGMAEVIKAGVIGSPRLFEALETDTHPDMAWLIREAVAVKIDVVQADPFERGRRAVLNLGHTFGHALEKLSDFRMRHGEGVAIGMVLAARLSHRLGHCPGEVESRVTDLLNRRGLPTRLPPYSPEVILNAMTTDKKTRGGKLRFVLPRAIGDVDLFDDVPADAVRETLGSLQHSEKPQL